MKEEVLLCRFAGCTKQGGMRKFFESWDVYQRLKDNHLDDYHSVPCSMLGGAQKEEQPLSLRNVAEQMRTLKCNRTRGFGTETQTGLATCTSSRGRAHLGRCSGWHCLGLLCTAVHSVHCVRAPGQSGRRGCY